MGKVESAVSYLWKWNGQVVGTGQQWSGNEGTAGTAYLVVTVSDHYGNASEVLQIEVVGGGCEDEEFCE